MKKTIISSATIIVPTFEEAKNIPLLIKEIDKLRKETEQNIDLLIMDDNSQDGSKEVLESIKENWVHYVIRKANRSLSLSVIEGFQLATGDVIVVMDGDLSHPVEAVPKLIESITNGYDFAIGSRYISGGSIDESWGILRKINSWGATLLAWPLTKVHDPSSGFFAFKRSLLTGIDPLKPTGYKIGLEMLVKSKCEKIYEVPIHFRNRKLGKSKLSFKEQLKYIRHIRRLYIYKYPELSYLAQFLVVGGLGVVVNLTILTLALALGVSTKLSLDRKSVV
jgi:dolichol-phosphate mannosyltransferase